MAIISVLLLYREKSFVKSFLASLKQEIDNYYHRKLRRLSMLLDWVVIFFVVSLIAAFFGYSGVAGDAAGIAKILFLIFLVLFVVSLLMRLLGKGPTQTPMV